jgi:hypothetical protein
MSTFSYSKDLPFCIQTTDEEGNSVSVWNGTTLYGLNGSSAATGVGYPSKKADTYVTVVGPGTSFPVGFTREELFNFYWSCKRFELKITGGNPGYGPYWAYSGGSYKRLPSPGNFSVATDTFTAFVIEDFYLASQSQSRWGASSVGPSRFTGEGKDSSKGGKYESYSLYIPGTTASSTLDYIILGQAPSGMGVELLDKDGNKLNGRYFAYNLNSNWSNDNELLAARVCGNGQFEAHYNGTTSASFLKRTLSSAGDSAVRSLRISVDFSAILYSNQTKKYYPSIGASYLTEAYYIGTSAAYGGSSGIKTWQQFHTAQSYNNWGASSISAGSITLDGSIVSGSIPFYTGPTKRTPPNLFATLKCTGTITF